MTSKSPSYHVLVVDDDEDIRLLIAKQLQALGHSYATASDGRQCLKAIQKEAPNLIIMDIRMPLMDGITTLKNLQQSGSPIPVIVYSGFLDDDSLALSSSLGAKAAFSKPLSQEELQRAISTYAQVTN